MTQRVTIYDRNAIKMAQYTDVIDVRVVEGGVLVVTLEDKKIAYAQGTWGMNEAEAEEI
jgi:hypothetical protein